MSIAILVCQRVAVVCYKQPPFATFFDMGASSMAVIPKGLETCHANKRKVHESFQRIPSYLAAISTDNYSPEKSNISREKWLVQMIHFLAKIVI